MNERWVCKRCFSSNDGNLGTCPNCGLARGSEVPDGEEAVAAAAASEPARSRWSGLLRFAWIPIVLIFLAAGYFFSARRDDGGQIVGGGDLQVTELQAGDCFDLPDPNAQEVGDVQAKPCAEPHQYQMFFVGDLPGGDYPTTAAMDSFTEAECLPAFQSFVGTPYETSRLDIFQLTPTEDGWNQGDHAMQCAVFDPLNEAITGSMRDSGL